MITEKIETPDGKTVEINIAKGWEHWCSELVQVARDHDAILRVNSIATGLHYFTPDDLAAEHAKERCLWSPINWNLVTRAEARRVLEGQANDLIDQVAELRERIERFK